MQLLELTPAEVAFLTPPVVAPDKLTSPLTRKLAATLSARLRLPVQLVALTAVAPAAAPSIPVWLPDAALATVWLVRRLGGKRVGGTTTFVPPTLLHTLDATLAECWLDIAAEAVLPPALAWTLTTDLAQAALGVQLPHTTTDMTRWARGVIQHG